MSSLALTLAPSKERRVPHVLVMAGLAIAGSLLMGGLAQWTIKLPFTPVPITGQTLGVLLIGMALGPFWGTTSMLLYLAQGALGMHFFAEGAHGTGWLFQINATFASGGYLWSYPLAAFVVGWLAKRGWDRSLRGSISAMFIGEVIIYAVGIPWLMKATGVPLEKSLEWGLYPFIIGDVLKLLLAACVLPAAWKLTGRGEDDGPKDAPARSE
jgi:biotin transport system substrate-specific component